MDSFRFLVVCLLCIFGFSLQASASFFLTMTSGHYVYVNATAIPELNVTCVLRDDAGQLVPLAGCGFKELYSNLTMQFNEGPASSNYTGGDGMTGKYQGRGLEHGECGITLGGYQEWETYILGCRLRPLSGGWQTAATMLHVLGWPTMQYHLEPPGATLVLAGSEVAVQGKAEHVLDSCRFHLPPAGGDTVVLDLDSGPDSANHSRGRYLGAGLDKKECGITLLDVQPESSGFVRGVVGSSLQSPYSYSHDFIELVVMSAPESPPLLTVLTPGVLNHGNFLEATCLVNNSRPAANITWHLGDVEVTRGITEDDDLDSTWRWNHDPQTVQSRLRLRVDSSHDGNKLSCRANHLASPSGFQNSTSVDIRVIA